MYVFDSCFLRYNNKHFIEPRNEAKTLSTIAYCIDVLTLIYLYGYQVPTTKFPKHRQGGRFTRDNNPKHYHPLSGKYSRFTEAEAD
jgi:hypothetical protein